MRSLPSIDELLTRPSLAGMLASQPRARTVQALRMAVDRARARLLGGDGPGFSEDDVRAALQAVSTPNLRPVLNATGVVLHTNLGRAPLAAVAVDRVREIAAGYSNLELDLEDGDRGSRYEPVLGLLQELTGAEAAVVVNNNAAAVLLVLSALCGGKEAVVSRGELVEIGGGFRVPDVMRQSGARLVEVGTTNRTRLADYEAAIGSETGLLVRVHRSNFALVGFTEDVPTRALAELGGRRGVPVFDDLGSGSLVSLAAEGLTTEPTVRAAVVAGADVVSFSGDKLLGGPQAGIVVGRAELIDRIRRHPLNRALRIDKMTVAALEATLELYRDGRLHELPTHRLLTQRADELEVRARRLQSLLEQRGIGARVVPTVGQVGGGAMPLAQPRSFACSVQAGSPQELQDKLRTTKPPVIARVAEEQLLLDVRCLAEEELGPLVEAVASVIQEPPC